MLLRIFRKEFISKPISILSVFIFLLQLIYPTLSYSLTSGPSQPEVQSFEPVSTSQMVDPFTGDFTYNIPLIDCGGYPINLSYHAGIGMDQEASWVGLGWNINPGVINRNMRGLPDDFKGDVVEKETNMKQFVQVGIDPRFKNKVKIEDEEIGFKYKFGNDGYYDGVQKLNFVNDIINYQIYYNNYKGIGYSIYSNAASMKFSKEFQGGLGLGYDSQEGLSISPSISYKRKTKENIENDKKIKFNASLSTGYSSRNGLNSIGIGKGLSTSKQQRDNNMDNSNFNSSYNFQNISYSPISKPNQFSYNYSVNFKYYNDMSASIKPKSVVNTRINADVAINGIHNVTNAYDAYGFLNEQYKTSESLSDLNSEGDNSFNKFTNNLRPSINTYDILALSGQGTGGSYKPNKNYYTFLSEPENKVIGISRVSIPTELGITNPKQKNTISIKESYTNFKKKFEFISKSTSYGKSVKIGADPMLTLVWGNNGLWDSNNGNLAIEKLDKYREENIINTLNEKVYYKNAAEKSVYDPTFFSKIAGTNAIKFEIDKGDFNTTTNYEFRNESQNEKTNFSEGLDKKGRAKRSEVISYLNAKEASGFGLDKYINSYSFDPATKTISKGQNISRADNSVRKSHHISEITSTTTDGSRYVYGLPVYNTEQIEYSFNVGEKTIDANYFKHGITTYDKNSSTDDRSMNNKKGNDHFFHSEKMPPYVHSWMLTAVLSSDYVDVTGDGPSPDDLGTYTKFNYQKLYSSSQNDQSGIYEWRTPTGLNSAHHNRSLKSDYTDDKGSLVTGKKEIWYLQSVETKTHIAVFILSDRNDGLSIKEDGSLNANMRMKKLERIELYNRNELVNANNLAKYPIKTVHFEYSYDLCPNTLNNDNNTNNFIHPLSSYNNILYNKDVNQNKGKLTLHKVWFTYGKNPKGALSPYIFEYKGLNPEYASKSMDRWGSYKPWNYHNTSGVYNDDKVSNAENPYVPQNEPLVDEWATAWNLTEIKLPSGGKINVEYESDDYSYVQDRKASQMYKILELNRTGTLNSSSIPNKLYDKENHFDVNNYIIFQCPPSATKEDIIGNLSSVYGSFYTHLNIGEIPRGFNLRKEHIQGYMEIEEANVSNGIGYIKVKPSFLGDKDNGSVKDNIHPMTKQAFQFIREQASFLAYPGYTQKSDNNIKSIIGSLFSFIPEFGRTILGHEHYLREKNYASSIDLDNSYIKLYNSNGFKKGGGHRVKKITVNDNWDILTNNNEGNFTSGQEYDYTTYEKEGDFNSKKISSGVASWEPMVGGDENTHRERIQFNSGSFTVEEKNALSPNNFRYEEGPIGESFFPVANVGYSKVTIRNIKPSIVNTDLLKKHGTGVTVNEFYTAKDFPTKTERTGLDVYIRKNVALSILGISKEKSTASQGFAIELNDMHGKLKSIKNYSEFDLTKVINGTEYIYHTDNVSKKLNNHVTVISKDGEQLSQQPVGIEVELFSNAERSEHNALTGATAVNYHAIFPNSGTPPIIPILTIVPSMSYSRSVVNVITTTKVIHRFGLIHKVNVIEDNATLSTENLAWDAETGEVLYSKTQNEYGDYDYSITKPAHWVEEGMSGAYQNIGAELLLKTTNISKPGEVEFKNVKDYGKTNEKINNILFPGDELIPTLPENPNQIVEKKRSFDGLSVSYVNVYLKDLIANTPTTKKYWVLSTSANTANLIDSDGNPIPFSELPYYFKIVRSGHRNLLTAPAEQITSKVPISQSGWANASTLENVLNGSALLYSDKWQTYYKPPIMAKINCELGVMDINEPLIDNNTMSTPPNPTNRDFAEIDFSNTSNWQSFSFCNDVKLPGDFVNPYTIGIRGNWRPWYSMVYFDRTNANAERTQNKTNANNANTTDTRTAGTISNYVPFYQYSSILKKWEPQWVPGNTIHNQWLWQNRATLIGPNSEELENENAMQIFSSALYGYQKKLPVAVVGNAKYQDIMFDGFEEYNTGFFTAKCPTQGNTKAEIIGYPEPNIGLEKMICENLWHWPLWKGLANGKARITSQNAHTGKHSLMVTSTATIPLDNNDLLTGTNSIANGKFFLSASDFIPIFSPKNLSNVNAEFLISYWTYGNGNIEVKDALGNDFNIIQVGSSVVVDGWKRFEGKIIIPQGQRINDLRFVNNNQQIGNPPSSSNQIPVLFDDLRILPFMSNMNSYVYDNLNLRLMATLSENNFATFYEYDEEGSLIRTKIETEKGIMTIQESRSSLRKK